MTFTPMPHMGVNDEIRRLLLRAPKDYAKSHAKNAKCHEVTITAFDDKGDPDDEGTVVFTVSGPWSRVVSELSEWLEGQGL